MFWKLLFLVVCLFKLTFAYYRLHFTSKIHRVFLIFKHANSFFMRCQNWAVILLSVCWKKKMMNVRATCNYARSTDFVVILQIFNSSLTSTVANRVFSPWLQQIPHLNVLSHLRCSSDSWKLVDYRWNPGLLFPPRLYCVEGELDPNHLPALQTYNSP